MPGSNLDYGTVRKTAKMIGSLYWLRKKSPTLKQRMTALVYNGQLILYRNGKNPQVPELIVPLFGAEIFEAIDQSLRFCIHSHEFEALDEDERREWIEELSKHTDEDYDILDGVDEDDLGHETDLFYEENLGEDGDDGESSIYEEVGDASSSATSNKLIYDVPKKIDNSPTPPPPLPTRMFNRMDPMPMEDDFPPPPPDFKPLPPPPPPDHELKLTTTKSIPPPPPLPKITTAVSKPIKMIPPPPPPNCSKIQIFTKGSFKITNNIVPGGGGSGVKLSRTHSAKESLSQLSNKLSPASLLSGHKKESNQQNGGGRSQDPPAAPNKKPVVFDEELKLKLLDKKSSSVDIDEVLKKEKTMTTARRKSDEIEDELDAILRRRRNQISTPNLQRKQLHSEDEIDADDNDMIMSNSQSQNSLTSSLKKSASMRITVSSSALSNFATLPRKPKPPMGISNRMKPKLPDKKPSLFMRSDSLRIQPSWSARISSGKMRVLL